MKTLKQWTVSPGRDSHIRPCQEHFKTSKDFKRPKRGWILVFKGFETLGAPDRWRDLSLGGSVLARAPASRQEELRNTACEAVKEPNKQTQPKTVWYLPELFKSTQVLGLKVDSEHRISTRCSLKAASSAC